jgi:D-tagatose-1,6-bisphosphate aldolase subunit GatZ/KbaZ
MKNNYFLGLGPMSLNIINSIDKFAKLSKKKIMLICSRNQIETDKLGGGYVNNFNTKSFSDYIKKKKK